MTTRPLEVPKLRRTFWRVMVQIENRYPYESVGRGNPTSGLSLEHRADLERFLFPACRGRLLAHDDRQFGNVPKCLTGASALPLSKAEIPLQH